MVSDDEEGRDSKKLSRWRVLLAFSPIRVNLLPIEEAEKRRKRSILLQAQQKGIIAQWRTEENKKELGTWDDFFAL